MRTTIKSDATGVEVGSAINLSGTGWSPINYDPASPTVADTARAQREIWQSVRELLGEHLPISSRDQ